MTSHKYTNELIKETSPYLLQHAHNPVNWYPWGEEAFEKAKKENKPVFLSVGYSACHWCHVMEHESFEDESTAELMNKLFVNVKVDREERPDVDTIYMNVVQMLTGHGGWPMSVFMTPDKKPYYGGTYFPKERRYNMPAFREILVSVSNYYHNKKDSLENNTELILKNLNSINDYKESNLEISGNTIKKAIKHIEGYFDYKNGGFGNKPKFPNTFNIDLLLRFYKETKDKEYLDMVELTLKKMCNGGIYDHLGGGFYRYSTDEIWLIPHFEKMLYDNSLLIKQLLEVHQVTKNDFYKLKAEESLEYVIREMTNAEGGFYATQDADSEGEEGKFYTWEKDEILTLLGKTEGEKFCDYFDISEEGNFEHGKSNLQVMYSISDFAKKEKMTTLEVEDLLKRAKNKLFGTRNKRIFPGKDTKILTSWNGLMLSAFAKGYEVLKDTKYLEIAEKTINFIFENLYKNGLLLRSYKDNQAKFNAYLEDYAFFTQALLDFYQVTLNKKWLEKAIELNKTMLEEFWDDEHGAFFFTGKHHEELIVKTKEVLDHSIPSGNSIALKNLIRIARITEDKELAKKIELTIKVFAETCNKYFSGAASLICTLDSYLKPPVDIVLVGNSLEEVTPFIKTASNFYEPDRVFHFLDIANSDKLEIFKGKTLLENKATAYVCKNFVCNKPINNPEELTL